MDLRPLSERIELEEATWLVAWWECEKSVETFARFVYTKDENAAGDESIKKFPTREQKPYIWEFIDAVQREQILLCEKSRQLMVTWAMVLFIVWACKFQKRRLWFLQSKKEEDAANLVYNSDPYQARGSFIEWNLPDPMRSDVLASYGKMRYLETESLMWGIPEGGHQIRSYTPSGLFSDEAAFQPEFSDAYKAARPAIMGGGKLIAVSSARSGAEFYEMIRR